MRINDIKNGEFKIYYIGHVNHMTIEPFGRFKTYECTLNGLRSEKVMPKIKVSQLDFGFNNEDISHKPCLFSAPISQLKILLALKPDLTIKDLIGMKYESME